MFQCGERVYARICKCLYLRCVCVVYVFVCSHVILCVHVCVCVQSNKTNVKTERKAEEEDGEEEQQAVRS